MAGQARVVDVLTFGAVNAHCAHTREVGLADWQHGLALAKDPRAAPKLGVVELFRHRRQAAVCQDKPRMYKSI
jgi:hypothetical protein